MEVPPDREAGPLGDSRRAAFYRITVDAAEALRAGFTGRRRATARAIYDTFAEVANEHRSTEFESPRQRLAELAGVSDRTLDSYVREFERLGLLGIERRRDGALNLSNLWRLRDPNGGGEANRPTSRSQPHHGGETNDARGGEANNTPLKKNDQEGKKAPRALSGDSLPANFPEELVPVVERALLVLDRIFEAKGGKVPTRRAVARVVAERPHGDHDAALVEVERWLLREDQVHDAVAALRSTLSEVPALHPAARTSRPPSAAPASASRSKRHSYERDDVSAYQALEEER